MNSYLLIDTSYMVFFRYYAIRSWYNRAFPDALELDEDIIINKFQKRFIEGIEELSKKYKTPYNNIFLCCDCPQQEIWRKEIYPEYKNNRKDDPDVSKAFTIFFEKIYPLLQEKNIKIMRCEHAEADDIAAIITKQLQQENKVTIITSDQDYLQLLNDNTQIFNLSKKKNNLRDKSLGDPYLDLQVKIIIGDKSDNISGCFPRCGQKTAINYIKENKLESLFIKYPDSKNRYEINKKLIDFDFIPNNIRKNIISQLKKKL